jgi:hypothetical protein
MDEEAERLSHSLFATRYSPGPQEQETTAQDRGKTLMARGAL